jgi:hypothetical protein
LLTIHLQAGAIAGMTVLTVSRKVMAPSCTSVAFARRSVMLEMND